MQRVQVGKRDRHDQQRHPESRSHFAGEFGVALGLVIRELIFVRILPTAIMSDDSIDVLREELRSGANGTASFPSACETFV
jgi:hypothetical protein